MQGLNRETISGYPLDITDVPSIYQRKGTIATIIIHW